MALHHQPSHFLPQYCHNILAIVFTIYVCGHSMVYISQYCDHIRLTYVNRIVEYDNMVDNTVTICWQYGEFFTIWRTLLSICGVNIVIENAMAGYVLAFNVKYFQMILFFRQWTYVIWKNVNAWHLKFSIKYFWQIYNTILN